MPKNLRLSVAQLQIQPDPGDTAAVRECGEQIRHLMREARAAGARLLHLPEGALACPSKRVMSATGPDEQVQTATVLRPLQRTPGIGRRATAFQRGRMPR